LNPRSNSQVSGGDSYFYIMGKEIKKADRLIVFNKYNGRCAYCGVDLLLNRFHVDHIIARQRGRIGDPRVINGRNHIENYNPSCPSCNINKSTFSIDEWRKELHSKIQILRRDTNNFKLVERFGLVTVNDIKVKFYFEQF